MAYRFGLSFLFLVGALMAAQAAGVPAIGKDHVMIQAAATMKKASMVKKVPAKEPPVEKPRKSSQFCDESCSAAWEAEAVQAPETPRKIAAAPKVPRVASVKQVVSEAKVSKYAAFGQSRIQKGVVRMRSVGFKDGSRRRV
mmetsp:Transcript_2438/g.9514  ORF Transcript_2438/g.9514 Transcript_2438/m.9514 type:complete len:141 (-) Transcript_2438:95-517(-)